MYTIIYLFLFDYVLMHPTQHNTTPHKRLIWKYVNEILKTKQNKVENKRAGKLLLKMNIWTRMNIFARHSMLQMAIANGNGWLSKMERKTLWVIRMCAYIFIKNVYTHKTNFQRTRDVAGLKISPTAVKSASLYQLSMSSFTVRNGAHTHTHTHSETNTR